MNIDKLAVELEKFTKKENIHVNEPMKDHTTFKVGGPADILVEPCNEGELVEIIKYLNSQEEKYMMIGNGSNLIVKDSGIRGTVIKLFEKLKYLSAKENLIKVGAGTLMSTLSKYALDNNLTGLEFASGIPGTVGGGVTMNAGAYGYDISTVFKSCKVVNAIGEVISLSKEDMKFGYRKSEVQDKSYIVLEAEFELKSGNYNEIEALMLDLNKRRRDKQPLEYPSAGSIFKRPEGYFTGKLIQDSGLSGFQIGGAAVSTKHRGFIINVGGATATDITELIKHIQDTVNQKFGVMLETEVKIIG
jgi:UDP-N-acetylmuramate dehydrogenase